MLARAALVVALAAGLMLAACGPDEDLATVPPQTRSCKSIEPGSSPIRRLTRFEYDRTIRDLLGDDSHPSSSFPPEEESLGYDNQATSLDVTPILAEQYMKASEAIAARAVTDLTKLLPCDPKMDETSCAQSFAVAFGSRAFRRPIDSGSVARLMKVYTWGR